MGIIPEVWYSAEFATNLVSVSDLETRGLYFNSKLPGVTNERDEIVALCTRYMRLYVLETDNPQGVALAASYAASVRNLAKPVSTEIWHRRLGHLSNQRIERLAEMVDGIEIERRYKETALSNPKICAACQQTQAQRQISRRSVESSKVYGKFGRIHFDDMQVEPAFNGHQWITHLYIEGIRFHLIKTHNTKDGCRKAVLDAIATCRNQFGMHIRVFKSGNEKSLDIAFANWLAEEGIV